MVEKGGPIRKIIFLVYWPVTQREVERFKFNYLISEGFSVEVYDLSLFLNSEALLKCHVDSIIAANYIHRIFSFQDLDAMVREAAFSAVFVDSILGLSGPDMRTEKIYRILKKNEARYFVVLAGALPVPFFPPNMYGALRNLSIKLRNASNHKKLWNFIASKLISFVRKNSEIYALPYRIFAGDSEFRNQFVEKYSISRECVIPIHSNDYDDYLNYIRSQIVKPVGDNGSCIFIDEAATHHSDFYLLNIKPISAEKYFQSMNRIFDLIENKTGLKVIVAAHPRSNYDDIVDVFGGREIVKGKTIELVARSSMVIAHMSTAVSYAVILNKPVLIVKTSEMAEHNHFSIFIDTIAQSLGVTAVNIDVTDDLNNISFDYSNWHEEQYDDYKYKYVKSKALEDVAVWEVVAKEIHRLNSL